MPKRKIIGLLTVLGLGAQLARGQLQPDCNPLEKSCPAKKALDGNYYIDFTKQTGPPADWIIANYEVVKFTPKGAEFTYGTQGDAPNMWTDFYILGGRYDVEMQIAPGQGVVSSSVLWSDIQDEIDWEFSGNAFGEKPFPPGDGMWTCETNVFARGKMWNGAATYPQASYQPSTQFHTYSVEWDETHITWFVDNKQIRSVQASSIPSGSIFPQSPMKLQLGVWGGGDPKNNYWTIQWAGGEIDITKAPYTMYVRSVNITNKYPACEYRYKDNTGMIGSIDKIQSCSPTSSVATSTSHVSSSLAPNLVKNNPGVDDPYSASPLNTDSQLSSTHASSLASHTTTSSEPHSISHSVSSSTSGSHTGYPVVSLSTHTSSSSSATTSSTSSSHTGYPVVSLSTHASSSSSAGSHVASTVTHVSASSSAALTSHSGSSQSSHVSSNSPAGYPVASQSSALSGSTSKTASHPDSASSVATTSHPGSATGYPTVPLSKVTSSGGILSSLSSYILGSSSSLVKSSTPKIASSERLSTSASSLATISSSHSVSPARYSTASSPAHQTMPGTAPRSGSSKSSGVPTSNVATMAGSSSRRITRSTISTVYSTNIYTVTSCPPTVTNCPVGKVSTELVSLRTTICPVEEESLTPSISSSVPTGGSVPVNSSGPKVSSSHIFSTSPIPTSSSKNSHSISIPASLSSSIVSSVATEASSSHSSLISSVNSTMAASSSHANSGSVPASVPAISLQSSTPTLSSSVAALSSHLSASLKPNSTNSVPSAGITLSVHESSSVYKNSTAAASQSSHSTPAAIPTTPVQLTTSTVYSTNIYTITSCAPDVTDCPARKGSVTTELISLYTTICPVSELAASSSKVSSASLASARASSKPPSSHVVPMTNSSSTSPKLTTSTVYTSSVYTVSSCAPGAVDCSSKIGSITTDVVALYTTICPVEETATHVPEISSSAAPTPTSVVKITSQTTHDASSTLAESVSSSPILASPSSVRAIPSYSTSTVYSTNIYTITSCAPDITDCPARKGSVTTEIIAVSTTVCPITESYPVGATSVPPVVAGQTTAKVTLSNTYSDSVIIITSVITYVDTPAPYHPTVVYSMSNSAGTAIVPVSSGVYQNSTQPCTTLTLGNHFTTVITYASITSQPPATVVPGSVVTSHYIPSTTPAADVPSYSMSQAESTVAMSYSNTAVIPVMKTTGSTEAVSEKETPSAKVTTLTSSVTNVKTIFQSKTSEVPAAPADDCVCPPASTVYATMTVTIAQTTVTATKTVQPPFPLSQGTGTGAFHRLTSAPQEDNSSSTAVAMSSDSVAAETTTDNAYAMSPEPTMTETSDAMAMTSGYPMRRWFRRGPHGGHGHGHGHLHGG